MRNETPITNNKLSMLLPYDSNERLLPIDTIRNIISNIRSKVSKDANIIIQVLNQEDFDYLLSTDISMQDGISILIFENYFSYEKLLMMDMI